ncbi:hypothetical protein GCK32_007373 [Trichostrongylus colubriformis]|uniref:Uncharacterized protein n=1 Tax=Trichostrongylus colubriformis TaxID=6319 RepID=A0AAN8EY72_TRICO
MVVLCLVLVLIFSSVYKRRQFIRFERRKLPITMSFDEVAVVTNLDHCNEFARVLLSEGYSMFAIAFSMQICLMLSGPHRSGMGGSSAYAYVENAAEGKCTTLNTFGLDKDNGEVWDEEEEGNLTDTKECFWKKIGKHLNDVVAPPGEIITLKNFYERIPEEERMQLIALLKLYRDTWPLSSPYQSFIRLNEDAVNLIGTYDIMINVHRMWLDLIIAAGERGSIQWSSILTILASNVNPVCKPREGSELFNKNMEEYWKAIEMEENTEVIREDQSVCMMKLAREAVPKYSTEVDSIAKGSYYSTLWRNSLTLLNYMESFYNSLSHKFQWKKVNISKMKQSRREKWAKLQKQRDWASNMFVIVNRTSQSALAYVGTLGSELGSGAVSGMGFLNDLTEFARAASSYGRFENAIHRLLPAIIFSRREGLIKLAYANTGGGILVSRAIPRLMYAIIFQGRSVPIEHIMVSPMAFLDTATSSNAGQIVFLDGIEYTPYFSLTRQRRIGDTEIDESVAIEYREQGPNQEYRLFGSHADVTNKNSFPPSGI